MTQIRDYAAEYDQHLLTKARQLAGLNTSEDRRAWLLSHTENDSWGAEIAAEGDDGIISAYLFGITKATLGELVRWLERIPEAHRG